MFVGLLNIFSWAHSSVSPAPQRGQRHDKKSRKFNTLGGLGHHHGSCQNKQGLAQGCKVLSQGKHCPLPDGESCFARAVCVLGGRETSSTKPLDHSPHPGSDICSHQPCAERAGGRGGGGRGDSHSHSRKMQKLCKKQRRMSNLPEACQRGQHFKIVSFDPEGPCKAAWGEEGWEN